MVNVIFLKTFVTLVKLKNFTRTAEELHMTQPGVSQHLRWLEEYFGCELIIREKRNFILTEKGQALADYALRLFAEHEQFCADLLAERTDQGRCRFAAPGSFGMLFNEFLLHYGKKHPLLQCSLAFAPNTTIFNLLRRQEIEGGFVNYQDDAREFVYEQVAEEQLLLICPRAQTKTAFADLNRLGLINHPDARHHVTRYFKKSFAKDFHAFSDLTISGFSNQIALIPQWVAAGLGYTVLPEYAVRSFRELKKLKVVAAASPIVDPVFFAEDRLRRRPARISQLIERFKQHKFQTM